MKTAVALRVSQPQRDWPGCDRRCKQRVSAKFGKRWLPAVGRGRAHASLLTLAGRPLARSSSRPLRWPRQIGNCNHLRMIVTSKICIRDSSSWTRSSQPGVSAGRPREFFFLLTFTMVPDAK